MPKPSEVAEILIDNRRFIEMVMAEDGIQGNDGKDGKRGPIGPTPKHEWDGTKIRFENPDGSWGSWTDLKGKDVNSFSLFGGPMDGPAAMGLEKVRGLGGFLREGVSEIYFGANITLTRTPNGVRVDAQGGSGGSSIAQQNVTAVQSGDNVTIDLTQLSNTYTSVLFVTQNGVMADQNRWSIVGDTLTLIDAYIEDTYQIQYTY
jgi:hypothetical protein